MMRGFEVLVLTLLILGGFNWLLVGIFQWDLFGGLFGGMNAILPRILFTIVGLASLYGIKFYADIRNDNRATS